jgi:hypothetical protein
MRLSSDIPCFDPATANKKADLVGPTFPSFANSMFSRAQKNKSWNCVLNIDQLLFCSRRKLRKCSSAVLTFLTSFRHETRKYPTAQNQSTAGKGH